MTIAGLKPFAVVGIPARSVDSAAREMSRPAQA